MANLIKAYFTRRGIPRNKDFIPGDVIVFERTNKRFLFEDEIFEELYIFDLNKKVRFISRKCQETNKFKIKDESLKMYLGKHWEKYKISYIYTLKIPFET